MFLYLLLIVLLCVKDTVSIIMATTVVISKVTNAYKSVTVNGKSELIVDNDKSLLHLNAAVTGIVKDDAGNYNVSTKSELSIYNVVLQKLVHTGLEQFPTRAILEDRLDNVDNNIEQCRQWLRGAVVDIEATEGKKTNKETGEVTKTINYSFSNVRLAIPEDEIFLIFMDYVAEKNYSDFMIKMTAKKFGIEL